VIILFYGEGRLGNQVFQYQALSTLAGSDDSVIAVGLEQLQNALDLNGPSVHVITRSRLVKRLIKYLLIPLLLRPLCRTLRLTSYAFERESGEGDQRGADGEIAIRRGLFSRLLFVDGGFYQNGALWSQAFPAATQRLRATLRQQAHDYLQSATESQRPKAFVHVRRGDYLAFSAYGLGDLSLPESFYRNAIATLRAKLGEIDLVFVTDDPQWVRERFADIEPKAIASFSPMLDFAIMAECDAGILSNSTFSLAAALLLDHPQLVIGPQYWFGFRTGEWLPPRIRVYHPQMLYLPASAQ
jgi:hypothetical protein